MDAVCRWRRFSSGMHWAQAATSKVSDQRVLVPIRFDAQPYNPLSEVPDLFRKFADVAADEDSIRAFANAYGPLGLDYDVLNRQPEDLPAVEYETDVENREALLEDARPYRYGDAFNTWATTLDAFRSAVARYDVWRATGSVVARHAVEAACTEGMRETYVGFELSGSEEGRPSQLRVRVGSLAGAVWVQLARAVEGRVEYRACQACGRWLAVPDATAGRADRAYCGTACRSAAYRARKSLAVRLAGEGVPAGEIADRLGVDQEAVLGWTAGPPRRNRSTTSRGRPGRE